MPAKFSDEDGAAKGKQEPEWDGKTKERLRSLDPAQSPDGTTVVG
ncbi:hypothetical protein AB0I51_12650 [Streptomyces sp. NPDC050549]